MQDPNQDTEWNDVLRAKGILPPHEAVEVTEEDLVNVIEKTIAEKSREREFSDMKLDELNELEDEIDDEDERIFEAYRKQRIEEMKAAQQKARYGDVREISRDEYVREVNEAGQGIWVILLVYKPSIPACKLMEQFFYELAAKFPAAKFLKSVSSVCIPNYPDKNLPTVFVYRDGELRKQFIGPAELGGSNLSQDGLEWMLAETGAIETQLEQRPWQSVDDVMMLSVRHAMVNSADDSDSDDL